jgi:SepF-like predicted cell division protein (DUF552 family)
LNAWTTTGTDAAVFAIIHSVTLAHQVKGDIACLEEAGIFVDPNAVKIDFEKVMEGVRKI